MMEGDEHWMRAALGAAREAQAAGEVPVGAAIVREGVLIATGRNAPRQQHDPTAHAEIAALRAAAQQLGNYRLDGCTLYVTLEPCLMCAGAMLHARLARVVFGAPDPKTGAAGSVFNVFAEPRLNHQTALHGGVLAAECTALLQDFFGQRRRLQRTSAQPLRDDALRTPDARMAAFASPLSRWVSDLPTLQGLRLHYLDLGPGTGGGAWLLLHGARGWSWQWRDFAPALVALGQRVIVPDLIGFGRSDKPKKAVVHSADWHAQVLKELLARLGLNAAVLGLADGQGATAWPHRLLPHCAGALLLQLPAMPAGAANAPYPDEGHRAGPRALEHWSREPRQVPDGMPWFEAAIADAAAAGNVARRAVEYFAPVTHPDGAAPRSPA
ncbi:tRNA adenosine(34) deaminase TadA [Comamonas badia]|uniref:tRNA adenosine(34) deaminase TadA n=1 Tax=Comamonas badia TaxID=265291 RepID=UPI0003F94ECB|nr:tRNA adenosine(34) deaminase TadA [Comamonas badia]